MGEFSREPSLCSPAKLSVCFSIYKLTETPADAARSREMLKIIILHLT